MGTILAAIFQPHTHTVFNYIDSILFGGLAIISALWQVKQSDHFIQVLSFFIPLPFIVVLFCWKVFKKLALGGRLKAYYLQCCCLQGIKFTELSTRNSSANVQEQRPLLDKGISPDVSCTVVTITN